MKTAHAGREPELTISGLRSRPVDSCSPPVTGSSTSTTPARSSPSRSNVVDGLAYPPERPGAGLQWDEAEVRRWAVS